MFQRLCSTTSRYVWEDSFYFYDLFFFVIPHSPSFICYSLFLFFSLLQLRDQTDANIQHIVNGNMHVCNQISQLIHGTNYPQRHDKVKSLKTCINNVIELLRMWKFADRHKKKRHSTALVLHKFLAKLESLKKQIDRAPVGDLPKVEQELNAVARNVMTQNFEDKWRKNIRMLIERYRVTLQTRMGSVSGEGKKDANVLST